MAIALVFLMMGQDMATVTAIGFVVLFLALPLIIQWNHLLLIFCWNSTFIFGFMPGEIQVWIVLAAVTFLIAVIHRSMGHRAFLPAPELAKPILLLVVVVFLTAKIRGGWGMRAFGSSNFGGRNYFTIIAAVIGYFGLISQQISMPKSARIVKWFFLGGMTNAVSTLLYAIGPFTYFLFWIIPASNLSGQIVYDWHDSSMTRIQGFGAAGSFLMCFALARWGIGPLFIWRKPWRMLLMISSVLLTLFSGFRSDLLFLIVLFVFQFIIEGWWKTALLPIMIFAGAICLMPLLIFANKMPSAVQRCLAFLPVNIDPAIRVDAANSIQWRRDMWTSVLPEVPKYLLVGKGYEFDPDEYFLTVMGSQQGRLSGYEAAMLAGDYHNGPLSVLIPLGFFGMAALLWLLGAGAKVLYVNYRFGDARLRRVNITLLAYFLAQALFFLLVFGAFSSQLSVFLGILGLSVSLNGGVCRREAPKPAPAPASPGVMLEPA
ncbi:MAG TPA: O-antigen ligase family protein [Verrucomicrobiae bacterium]